MLLFICYSSLFRIKIEISCKMCLYSRLNTVFFEKDIDKNYVVVKLFPTLSNWVYLYLSAMSIRLDEIVKNYD
jgi:hypothetical protein